MTEPRECRCCRTPVPAGRLACHAHWFALPPMLRQRIMAAYRGGVGVTTKEYVAAIASADEVWKHKGLWKPGTPKGAAS